MPTPAATACHPDAAASQRRGTTLIELIVTMTLFGTLAVLLGPMLQMNDRQQRETDRHAIARLELGNVMERIAAESLQHALTAEFGAGQTMSEGAKSQLPEAEFSARLDPDAAGGLSKVTIELSWKNSAGQRGKPARLVAWFRSQGDAP